MIPEVVVAMLACARIGAPHNVVFGGFAPEAVRERMEVSHAKALITVDGARRKGKTAPVKAAVDDGDGRPRVARAHRRRAPHRDRDSDDAGSGRVLRRDPRRRGPGLPGGADGGRAPAVHPLQLGLDREAEGDRAHHRRVPDRRQLHPPVRVRPRPRARRLLLLGRRWLDHRPLLHRLRPAGQRSHERDVRGRARLPGQGHLVGARRALRRDDLLHRADGDPRLHEVGRRAPERARPLVVAPAGDGRRADQPQSVALVPRRDRPGALPDRRHVVADRDRPDHDLAAARPDRDQAGLGDLPAAGRARRRGRRDHW